MLSAEHVLVTGGAGFIGSNMVDRLLAMGHAVTVYDNFSTGCENFLREAKTHERFTLIEADLADLKTLKKAMRGVDCVYHFAANADVRHGIEFPSRDLEQNTIATFNVLEAMRCNQAKRIVFSSTGSIYGEATVFPTPENAPFPIQTSLYGASKLACEGLITAYCEAYDMQSWIFRFVSVLGERYTHGHVFDFHKALLNDPKNLTILGDGQQRKSYMYVQDCLDAILLAMAKSHKKTNIFNLGYPEFINVKYSVNCITEHLNVSPNLHFTGGERGWVGDNPFIFLDVTRIMQLGWQPEISIKTALLKTLNWLQKNEWVYEARV